MLLHHRQRRTQALILDDRPRRHGLDLVKCQSARERDLRSAYKRSFSTPITYTSAERQGFQRLIAEIGLGKAGLVLSLDASRLARNNRDWHQLLELCSIFGVIIADGDRLYDPGIYHDRLLLGLSGIMSEAELHQIRLRLHQGERQKAARGELRLTLPAGLAYAVAGEIILHPDEEVQARLRFVFSTFRRCRCQSRHAELQRHHLALPVRPLCGPAPEAVVWMSADSARVLQILQNPAYAGAYVYGRHRQDPLRRRADAPRCATIKVPVEQWPICLHDAHPGYIGWEEFMANQKRLAGNVASRAAKRPGAPRRGWALLQGIVVCGRCGRRMTLRYSGPHGDYPLYQCNADLVVTMNIGISRSSCCWDRKVVSKSLNMFGFQRADRDELTAQPDKRCCSHCLFVSELYLLDLLAGSTNFAGEPNIHCHDQGIREV